MSRSTRTQFGLFALLVLVGLAIGAALYVKLGDPGSPDSATAGLDERAACLELVTDFAEYPLYYLGEEFEGLPLTGCNRTQTPVKYDLEGKVREPATDFFNFHYGACTTLADSSSMCPSHVQVTVDPPCGPTLDGSQTMEKVPVRGVNAIVKPDGSVRIETPNVKVSIFASEATVAASRDAAIVAANALAGINAPVESVTAADSLDISAPSAPVCE
ncbi:MAG: hypothetical protein WEC75_06625 [Dehalococcoidia bacterium]